MTTDEKLKLFYETTIWDANAKYNKIIDELKQKADKEFVKFKARAEQNSKAKIKSEIDSYSKIANKNKSNEIIEFKQKKNAELNDLKNMIFESVIDKISDYKKTEKYKNELIDEINRLASAYDEIIIYLDDSDKHIIDCLSRKDKIKYEVSNENILGGYKALISSQNMIIDNSFQTKIEDEKKRFAF